jgi:hypothetical protein
MKKDCIDIGVIQAFIDGELHQAATARVSGHISRCRTCASMLTEAEDEAAIVFPALEREFDAMVPTQRLWNKINHSIEVERESSPLWRKAWTFLHARPFTPSMAAAAGLLVMLGLAAIVLLDRASVSSDVAGVSPQVGNMAQAGAKTPSSILDSSDNITGPVRTIAVSKSEKAAHHLAVRPVMRPRNTNLTAAAPSDSAGNVPGEESYIKAIASLARSVDGQKDRVMRPAERVSYERDLAVIDDSIAKMKAEVKRNPASQPARQVLYSSYQNKIDLLNSVSQKEELVASIR